MKLFIYKVLFKHKVVRYIMNYKDGRSVIAYAIPTENGDIKIGNGLYHLGERKGSYYKGVPTYIFKDGRIDPINPLDAEESVYPASYYDTGINSNVISEVFKTAKEDKPQLSMLFMIGAMVVGFIVLWYMLDTRLDEIWESLEPIRGAGGGN
jgi:hypothetical protein